MPRKTQKNLTKLSQLTREQKALLAVNAAALLADLRPMSEIAAQLNLSESSARRLINSDECKNALAELQGYSKAQAKAALSKRAKALMAKALSGLEQALDKGNVEGIKLVFKSLGLIDEKQVEGGQEHEITIIMPGSREEKSLDADYKKLSK